MSQPAGEKILLVTGGSRGIGATTARLAAANGYAVCVNHRAERAAAEALAGEGIRVNAIAPGLPDRVTRNAHLVPIGRAARPEEIAETILWLLSDKASYVTGAVLRAAGGR